MRRYITQAEATAVGFDFGVTAIQFLAQHVDLLRKLDMPFRVDRSTDNNTTSRFEIFDAESNEPIAAVVLTVGADGLAVLMGACSLSAEVHECAATKWKAPQT